MFRSEDSIRPATLKVAPRQPTIVAPDGTRLHVQDWGDGRPVVFVAAQALDSSSWGVAMMATLAAGFGAIAIDRRGHGRSDAPPFRYGPSRSA